MEPKALLNILHQAEKLKCVTRHCDTSTGRRESVAEHSWRLSVMALLCADEYPELAGKVLPSLPDAMAALPIPPGFPCNKDPSGNRSG